MGITIFKLFIWGGIWSDILLEITFYGSTFGEISRHIIWVYPVCQHIFVLVFLVLDKKENDDDLLHSLLKALFA